MRIAWQGTERDIFVFCAHQLCGPDATLQLLSLLQFLALSHGSFVNGSDGT